MIVDLSECKNSIRHGRYGGQAGDKDGIIYNEENWIVKYPKSTRGMNGNNLPSYTTSPLSEYIGSQIYKILGFDVHETMLAYRNNQICVACKDFQQNFGDLAEVRTLKNSANRELSKYTDRDLPMSATGDTVVLEELLLHFKENPLMARDDLIKRFWDCVIIDIFIDNNDRNNGNWGLLVNSQNDGYELAPIYDNGNSFLNKTSDDKIQQLLEQKDENRILGSRTAYLFDGHILSSKKMLNFENDVLKEELKTVVPLIQNNLDKIIDMIHNIPTEYKGQVVCSEYRKEYYIESLKLRYEKLLEPRFKELTKDTIKDVKDDDFEEDFER